MFNKKDNESQGIKQAENSIDTTNGYNVNNLYKPSNESIKASALKQKQLDTCVLDEYSEPILLEFGGYLLEE